MSPTPLSFRLLNDQTPVTFTLKSAMKTDVKDVLLVRVEEKGTEYIGTAKVLSPSTVASLTAAVKDYEAHLAKSESERKKVKVPVLAPTVEIARTGHDELPYIR